MNGVHDMGGMQGFGPIRPEKNEPVFHARWEGRIHAIFSALGTWRKWNGDFGRQTREFLPPAVYLALNYHQLRYAQVVELIAGRGMATRAEIERGRAAEGTRKATLPLTAGNVAARFVNGNPKKRDVAVAANFQAGQRVRARDINPPTHTHLTPGGWRTSPTVLARSKSTFGASERRRRRAASLDGGGTRPL